MEVGSGFGHDEQHTWSADILMPNWDLGKHVAFDLTVASKHPHWSVYDSGIICSGFRTKETCLQ